MLMRHVTSDGPLRLKSSRALDAALGLVSSIGDRRFPDLGIRQLNQLTPVGWWTVYRLRDGECPSLHLGGSTISAEVTARAFACYRDDGIWKHDHTFVEVREAMATVPAMMVHLHADEVHDLHRARIYRAFDLTERVSLLRRQDDGTSLSVNLYRGLDMPPFRSDELDEIACIGDLVLRAVESHLRFPVSDRPSPLDALPRREREVCDRLLRGMTHDGIGADLGLSVNTVKTYRDRAFDRLGIHHRSELFALVMQANAVTGQ